MDFLGLYNLFMALAVAGACTSAYDPNCGPDTAPDYAYTDDGGASALPPAWTIINRPPTMVDNGYNPNFYWNRPDNEYADENGYYPGYGNYGSYGSYQSGYGERYAENGYARRQGYGATYPTYSAAAATDDGYQGVYGDYDAGYGGTYYADGGDGYGYGYYQRPVPYEHERRAHRSAMARPTHDQTHDVTGDVPASGYDRSAVDQGASRAHDDRGAGFNGHDRRMFENRRGPAQPASADYQGRNKDGRDRPHQ